MTVVRKKSMVPELNQAKFGSVKLRQSYWSNFQIVVRSDQFNDLSFGSNSFLWEYLRMDEPIEFKTKLLFSFIVSSTDYKN